jgi:hypothetical protein
VCYNSPEKTKSSLDMQKSADAPLYEASLLALLHNDVTLLASTRAAALAAALGLPDAHLASALLAFHAKFDLPIILQALKKLDTPRQLRCTQAKAKAMSASQHTRLTRLASTAGVSMERGNRKALEGIDTRLGTGVRKLAKRMRTVQALQKLSTVERQRVEGRSRILNRRRLRQQLWQSSTNSSALLPATEGPVQLLVREETASEAPAAAEDIVDLQRALDSVVVSGGPSQWEGPLNLTAAERTKASRAVRRAMLAQTALEKQQRNVGNLQRQLVEMGVADVVARCHVAVSGACAKHIQRWIASLSSEVLESYIVTDQPRQAWQSLADIVHPRPSDFSLPSFLKWAFAGSDEALAAIDCDVIARYRCVQAALTTQDAAEAALAEGVPIDFSLLRRRFPKLQPTGAALTGLLAGPGVTLTQLLWFYGEGLQGEQVLGNMALRIAAGERLDLSFGKVLERILALKKHIALGIAQGEAASMIKIVLEKLDEQHSSCTSLRWTCHSLCWCWAMRQPR